MKNSRKKLIVLKIGGSVITHKNRTGIFLRRKVLARIAQEISHATQKDKDLQLIIIHGAGSGGHQLAQQYNLANGTGNDPRKWQGAILTRIASQKLNLTLFEILSSANLRIVPIHTASIVVQKNKTIDSCATDTIDQALQNNCIPFLYGELVFDTKLGMSICSGDTSAFFLAKKYDAEQVLFASDIDGIFNKDPHRYKDARMIHTTTLSNLLENKNIALEGSHSVDVTGGLANKISELARQGFPKSLKNVTIFNGLKPGTFKQALGGKSEGTVIEI